MFGSDINGTVRLIFAHVIAARQKPKVRNFGKLEKEPAGQQNRLNFLSQLQLQPLRLLQLQQPQLRRLLHRRIRMVIALTVAASEVFTT